MSSSLITIPMIQREIARVALHCNIVNNYDLEPLKFKNCLAFTLNNQQLILPLQTDELSMSLDDYADRIILKKLQEVMTYEQKVLTFGLS